MKKYKYFVWRDGSSSPLFQHNSVWEAVRFIVYALKGDYTTLIITKAER